MTEKTVEKKEEEKPEPLSFKPLPKTVEKKISLSEKHEAQRVAREREEKHIPKILESLIPIAEKLEEEYRRQKRKEIEDLHNALAEVIVKFKKERNVDLSHILTALEIVKHELVIEALRREGLMKG